MTDIANNPGTLLRERRLSLGLTTAEVARQLNLKTIVIDQLEQLTFDGTVAPTFLRGYLKLYVRLLKLNEQQLLQQFEPHLQTLTTPLAMHSFSHKTRREAAENRFMLATYFLAVLLISLSIVWFWQTHLIDNEPVLSVNTVADANALTGRQPATLPASQQPTENTVGTAENSAALLNTADISGPERSAETASLTAPNPASHVATAPEAAASQASLNQPATDPTSIATASTVQNPALQVEQTAAVNVERAEPLTVVDESQAVQGVEGTEQLAAVVRLELRFSAQCWLEVTDANGKRLAYQMAAAGQQLQLDGVSPVRLVLGDPAAVQLVRNGQPVDLSAYQRGRAARLTLTGTN